MRITVTVGLGLPSQRNRYVVPFLTFITSAGRKHAMQAILADALVAKQPGDPGAYDLRATARVKAGRMADALADFEKAASLDTSNAERQHKAGVALYEFAAQTAARQPETAREHLRRALAALERAGTLRPESTETLVYQNLVLQKLAELESDPEKRTKLESEANAVRSRAVELMKARSRS